MRDAGIVEHLALGDETVALVEPDRPYLGIEDASGQSFLTGCAYQFLQQTRPDAMTAPRL